MIQKIRLFIKKRFPNLYLKIRKPLFRIEGMRRKAKARDFTKSVIKTVRLDGLDFRINLDPKNGFVDRTIFTNGIYEPDILQVIKEHIKPGDVFIDIGANIGQHSLFAAAVVGKAGRVIAFEPIPRIVEQFKESIKLNGWHDIIDVHAIGCSNTAKNATLNIINSNVGGSSLHETYMKAETNIQIPLDRGDVYLLDLPRVDFIKLDTEGNEYEALQGLVRTIEKHHPTVLLEFSPSFRSDISGYDVLELLTERGYVMFDLEMGHGRIDNPEQWAKNFSKMQTNLLCFHQT